MGLGLWHSTTALSLTCIRESQSSSGTGLFASFYMRGLRLPFPPGQIQPSPANTTLIISQSTYFLQVAFPDPQTGLGALPCAHPLSQCQSINSARTEVPRGRDFRGFYFPSSPLCPEQCLTSSWYFIFWE